MEIDLIGTQVFVEIVKAGSFSRAARKLNMPASTVSDKFAFLEKSLGVSLLTRTTRSLKLTEAGEEYFRRSEPHLRDLASLFSEIAQGQDAPTGTLRISYPTEFAAKEIAEAVAEYRAKFPSVRVELATDNTPAELNSEPVDIAIRGGHLSDSSLKAKRLGYGGMIFVASPKYLQSSAKIQVPQDLFEHALIHFTPATGGDLTATLKIKRDTGGSLTLKNLKTVANTNSFATQKQLLLTHQGVAFAPEYFVRENLKNKSLIRVLPEWSSGLVPVHLVYPWHRIELKKVREMIPILSAKLEPLFKTTNKVL